MFNDRYMSVATQSRRVKMVHKGLLLCLLVFSSLTHVAVAADKTSPALKLVDHVDELLKQALAFRAQTPWHMSPEQLNACVNQALPYRVHGKELLQETRNASVSSAVRELLTEATDDTLSCLECKSDDSACYSAQRELKKARAALGG